MTCLQIQPIPGTLSTRMKSINNSEWSIKWTESRDDSKIIIDQLCYQFVVWAGDNCASSLVEKWWVLSPLLLIPIYIFSYIYIWEHQSIIIFIVYMWIHKNLYWTYSSSPYESNRQQCTPNRWVQVRQLIEEEDNDFMDSFRDDGFLLWFIWKTVDIISS